MTNIQMTDGESDDDDEVQSVDDGDGFHTLHEINTEGLMTDDKIQTNNAEIAYAVSSSPTPPGPFETELWVQMNNMFEIPFDVILSLNPFLAGKNLWCRTWTTLIHSHTHFHIKMCRNTQHTKMMYIAGNKQRHQRITR